MPRQASSHRRTIATLSAIVFVLVLLTLGLNSAISNQTTPWNSHCLRSDNDSNDNDTNIDYTPGNASITSSLPLHTTHHPILREPTTPPKSLPSDPFAHYIYQKQLPLPRKRSFSLKGGKQTQTTRTIVVGDVHGHLRGLNWFLEKIAFNNKTDTLILAGDIVTKGDQSLGVIDRARDLGAYCVRGNHDDKVVRWRAFLDSLSLVEQQQAMDDDDNDDDDVEAIDLAFDENDQIQISHKKHKNKDNKKDWRLKIPLDLDRKSDHYHLARTMTRAQYQYLRNCPLILTLPRQLSVHNLPVHVVHAGIDPSRDILKQRPWVLVNIRNLLKDGTPSSQRDSGYGWARAFNEIHCDRRPTLAPQSIWSATSSTVPRNSDFMIVYGHDASRSLNVMPWSIGLDSGCVYGRVLTGYVVETGEIRSVSCPSLPGVQDGPKPLS
ncbi:hypothetical protein BGZ83_001542 [Gryganskiella cystojenkinii]|nr:hypothetical protein BGZ83_001542 [Gryganskiella cystojenkinii]